MQKFPYAVRKGWKHLVALEKYIVSDKTRVVKSHKMTHQMPKQLLEWIKDENDIYFSYSVKLVTNK